MINWLRRVWRILWYKGGSPNRKTRMHSENPFGDSMPEEAFKPLQFPSVRRHFYDVEDTILYSYYLKQAGISQSLMFGDWYAVRDEETGQLGTKIYGKTDLKDISDFNFLTKASYIRLVSQEEALNVLNSIGFQYSGFVDSPLGFDEVGRAYINFNNDLYGLSFRVEGSNMHAAHLKALHIGWSYMSTNQKFNLDLQQKGFIDDGTTEDEEG